MANESSLFQIIHHDPPISPEMRKIIEEVVNSLNKDNNVVRLSESLSEYKNVFLVRSKYKSDEVAKQMRSVFYDEQADHKIDLLHSVVLSREDNKKIKFGIWRKNENSESVFLT